MDSSGTLLILKSGQRTRLSKVPAINEFIRCSMMAWRATGVKGTRIQFVVDISLITAIEKDREAIAKICCASSTVLI